MVVGTVGGGSTPRTCYCRGGWGCEGREATAAPPRTCCTPPGTAGLAGNHPDNLILGSQHPAFGGSDLGTSFTSLIPHKLLLLSLLLFTKVTRRDEIFITAH